MSRIGKQPVQIPAGVTITVGEQTITVAGPKGSLEVPVQENVVVNIEDGKAIVTRKDDEPKSRSWHGLQRALLNNAVIGVTQGFEKKLEINGVGYRLSGGPKEIEMSLGFSHPVKYSAPEGIELKTNKMEIIVSGIDKQKVGQTAAEIVYTSVDSSKENMGLTTWKNSPDGRILKSDVIIAKNYLNEKQIKFLERNVSGYFDYIEDLIERENTFTMDEFAKSVNEFLEFRKYKTLPNNAKGKISHKQAEEKALSEYDKFNKTQKIDSDFDKEVRKLLGG